MAIVEMKRLTLLGLLKDREKLLNAIQRLGCIQITDIPEEGVRAYPPKVEGAVKAEDTVNRLRWAIDKLGKYAGTKPPLFGSKPEVAREQADDTLKSRAELMAAVAKAEECELRAGELRGKEARLMAAREQLLPWSEMDVPVASIANTKDTVQQAGVLPKAALDGITQKWADAPAAVFEVGQIKESACVLLVAHASVAEAFLNDLKEAGFAQFSFGDVQGTPKQQLAAWAKEQEEVAAGQRKLEEELGGLSKMLPELKILHDILSAELFRLKAAGRFAATETAFLLKGWVPTAMVDKVRDKLTKVSPTVCLEASEPEEGEDPPVLLHNNPAAAPFESVVAGFSLPSPYGMDPTAIMAPFFACFFGMMVSDAGYGLMLAVIIPLLIKFFKPSPGAKKLMIILAMGGVFTLFWGFMYNTWFGFAPLPVYFDPVNNALPVMGLCIAIGAVHLFTGLFMGAALNFRRKQPLDALYDQFSWFFLVVGLGLMILPATAQFGKYMALVGAVIILLTAGRHKSKNPFKRLLSGLGALYGMTSWISDLLSYMRLFGMGLATGVIGMVINQLVGMIFAGGIIGKVFGILLFVGGHLFNAGINILGAYVHSCRLQYIEFFGKFYEEGGKPFVPLSENNRYVHIRDAKQA